MMMQSAGITGRQSYSMAVRMPLYRDGETMRNVPEDLMKWYAFMAWLNEKVEKGWVN